MKQLCAGQVTTLRGLGTQVAQSWFRSEAVGVSADPVNAPITLPDTLRDRRRAHPLASVFPLLEDVLGQAARD